MSKYSGRIAFTFLALILSILAFVHWAQSCADPGDPFTDYSKHPDTPFANYLQGQLGIVEPTFARSYLVIAYRYASGVPLTADEQEATIALWQNRNIDPRYVYANSGAIDTAPKNHYLQDAQDISDGPKDWLDARAQIVSSPIAEVSQVRKLYTYNEYLNCSDDAFANAAATLRKRAEKFGKDLPAIKDWVAAQDTVFLNCSGNVPDPRIPAAAPASLPELLRYDREYQIASAYMYSNRYDDAVESFQHIAAEQASPWRDIAPYLAARTLLRRATLEVSHPEAPENGYVPIPAFAPDKMQAAVEFTTQTLARQPHNPFVSQLRSLLDRAEFRLHPAEQTSRLAQLLSKPAPNGRFYDWLWDYTWLLDLRADASSDFGQGGSPGEYKTPMPGRGKDDLTDWIITFQMEAPEGTQHALDLWHAHRDSVPWLLSVLSKTQPNSPQISEVLSAAESVPASSSAYVSVFYHRMRLWNSLGKLQEVRSAIDSFLRSSADLSDIARDYFLDIRLEAASDLDDAVRFLPREHCSVFIREPAPNCPTTIAENSARYLDLLPLDVLMQVLNNKNLPDAEKAKFVRNVWLRAVVLGRFDLAQSLDAQAFRPGAYQQPLSDEVTGKLVKDFEAASSSDEKQFAAIFLMQHQYAFSYDIGTTGAWCASPRAFPDATNYDFGPHPPLPTGLPSFLTDTQRKQAETERSQLDKIDSQANYYTKLVLEFATRHSDDPRVPEALSRAVKNTRMNCNNARTAELSKAAFDLLHKRYPDTTWATSTKYWFGNTY